MPAHDLQKKLDASFQYINLCTTGHDDVRTALQAAWNDAEDALIGVSSKKIHADYLLTRDTAQVGFASLDVPVFTPEAFFEHLEQERGISYAEVRA